MEKLINWFSLHFLFMHEDTHLRMVGLGRAAAFCSQGSRAVDEFLHWGVQLPQESDSGGKLWVCECAEAAPGAGSAPVGSWLCNVVFDTVLIQPHVLTDTCGELPWTQHLLLAMVANSGWRWFWNETISGSTALFAPVSPKNLFCMSCPQSSVLYRAIRGSSWAL